MVQIHWRALQTWKNVALIAQSAQVVTKEVVAMSGKKAAVLAAGEEITIIPMHSIASFF